MTKKMTAPIARLCVWLLTISSAALVVACGSTPDDSAPSYWPDPTVDTGASDVRGDTGQPVAVDPDSTTEEIALACVAICDGRSVDGGCIPPGSPCHDLCFNAVVGAVEFFDDTRACLEIDPLCYQSLSQCVFGRRYPESFEHTVTLRGTGYEEFIGSRVIGGIEESEERIEYGQANVDPNGEFSLEIDVELHALDAHTVLYWIDLDDDGVCIPEEPTGSGTYQLDAHDDGLVVPDWVIEVDRAAVPDSAFVCDLL